MENNRPKVLVIAGVDSGGGAGITADCLTIHDNGAFPLPCVSALTAQSLVRITKVVPTDVDTFKETLDVAIKDWDSIDAIKIGLVTSSDVLDLILDYLEGPLKDVPVVWDPVLTGTAGDLKSADIKKNLKRILKTTTIFTPNLIEAMTLLDWSEDDVKQKGVKALGCEFVNLGCKCVIVKGGHNLLNQDSIDTFVSNILTFTMSNKRIDGEGAHGGGCALSSSLAALLANKFALEDAAVLAKAYVYRGIKNPAFESHNGRPPVGHHGLIDSFTYMPQVQEEGFPKALPSNLSFNKTSLNLGLYPVVDSIDWIKRLVDLGVKTIQLRIKDKDRPTLFDEIQSAATYCKQHQVRLFIDDHYELAIKAGAYGVHLGMEDLRDADIEKIAKSNLRLGVSTHGAYEMCKAYQLRPSYIALGHIFETQSKVMPSKPQGVYKLYVEQNIIKQDVPTVAIGGIKLTNVDDVLKTGVGSVALITGITRADDPNKTTKEWLLKCGCGDDYEG